MMSLRGLNRSSISDSGSRCCRGTGRGTLASRGDPGHCVLARERPPESGTCVRSEEHTSELQSLMRISYAVFCLKTKQLGTRQHCSDSNGTHENHNKSLG